MSSQTDVRSEWQIAKLEKAAAEVEAVEAMEAMVSELQSRCAKKARDRLRAKEQETGRQAESRGQQTDRRMDAPGAP